MWRKSCILNVRSTEASEAGVIRSAAATSVGPIEYSDHTSMADHAVPSLSWSSFTLLIDLAEPIALP